MKLRGGRGGVLKSVIWGEGGADCCDRVRRGGAADGVARVRCAHGEHCCRVKVVMGLDGNGGWEHTMSGRIRFGDVGWILEARCGWET